MELLAKIEMRGFPQPRMNHRGKATPRAKKYFQKVRDLQTLAYLEKKIELGRELNIVFVFAVPKNWSKRKKEFHFGEPHLQAPDLSNLIKAFEDALYNNNHPLGLDDKQIFSIEGLKVWGSTDKILIFKSSDKLSKIQNFL